MKTLGTLIVVAILALLFMPFVLIAALNTLFPVLAIGYNFFTWSAALVILMTFGKPSITVNK